MDWSPYQQDIFDFVRRGLPENLVVIARAGCGKTRLLVEIARILPRAQRSLFSAFGRENAKTLQDSLPPWTTAGTSHSLGLRMIRDSLGPITVDAHRHDHPSKGERIAEQVLREHKQTSFATGNPTKGRVMTLGRIVGFAKASMIEDHQGLCGIVTELGGVRAEQVELFASMARLCLDRALQQCNVVDFDDMIYFPWKLDLEPGEQFDNVLVDECQDLAPAQLWLTTRLCRDRMVVVGDPCQSLFSWRGAAPDAIDRMIEKLSAKVMTLPITYRCPRAVVRFANSLVPDLEAQPSAEEGVLRKARIDDVEAEAQPGDFILSRTNAPLVGLCMRFLSRQIPATIQGRDVARGLKDMIRSSKCQSVDALGKWLEKHDQDERARLLRLPLRPDRMDRALSDLSDRIACVRALAEGAPSIEAIEALLDRMFDDGDAKSKLVLSTVHRAKGLERDRVWVLAGTLRAGRGIPEEDNIAYVAYTRARKELILVAFPR